jgi:hypothetical protein
MERARATWTDERLDDLAGRMDAGFARVDADIRALRTELRSEVGGLRSELGARIDSVQTELGGRIDGLQRMTLQVGAGMIVTMLVGFASVLAAQLA